MTTVFMRILNKIQFPRNYSFYIYLLIIFISHIHLLDDKFDHHIIQLLRGLMTGRFLQVITYIKCQIFGKRTDL